MTYAELKRRCDILKANVKHLDRENQMLKVNLEATKGILLETESELNLATGKIEGYQECLRILRGHDDDKVDNWVDLAGYAACGGAWQNGSRPAEWEFEGEEDTDEQS